jgi:hypothetical protein
MHKKTMIPMLINPTFASRLQIGKIHHTTNRILLVSGRKKIGDVVMAMKIFALATMLEQSMARTKPNAPHNRKLHENLSVSSLEQDWNAHA